MMAKGITTTIEELKKKLKGIYQKNGWYSVYHVRGILQDEMGFTWFGAKRRVTTMINNGIFKEDEKGRVKWVNKS